jgi:hypothetical protein
MAQTLAQMKSDQREVRLSSILSSAFDPDFICAGVCAISGPFFSSAT